MGKFVRLVNDSIIDVFFLKIEDISHCYYHFENYAPNSFDDSELHCSGTGFPKQCSNSFIGIEAFDDRQEVVLYCYKRCTRNLGCEVPCLAFSESQHTLAVLEDDLQSPSLGVNPVCFKEVKREVCGDESVPLSLFAASEKEKTHPGVSENDISCSIIAFEFAAVFDLLSCLQQLDKRRSCKIFPFKTVFGAALFSDLDHSKVVASNTAAVYKFYNLRAGEPAVGQNVAETDTFLYSTLNHVNGKCNLAEAVFFNALPYGSFFRTRLTVSGCKLTCCHAEVVLLPRLAHQCKIQHHLAYAVCDGKRQSLKAKYRLVFDMREYAPHEFKALSRLAEIRVIDNQAGGAPLVIAANTDLVPELHVEMVKQFAPIDSVILGKTVEHIFSATHHAA